MEYDWRRLLLLLLEEAFLHKLRKLDLLRVQRLSGELDLRNLILLSLHRDGGRGEDTQLVVAFCSLGLDELGLRVGDVAFVERRLC